ncbi:hypothetical protein LCGC14_1988800, partial [marine sediment metagenome]
PRQAERMFGWSRNTVELGLNELRTGITCLVDSAKGANRKTEEKLPQLEEDIRSLAEPQSQQDPKFQSPFKYSRMTAKAMRRALIDKKGWKDEELPCEKTIGNILNRLGYRLRRVQKAKPIKKVRQTDDIFANVERENQASDEREDSLRISIDGKAELKLGDFSRGGKSRGQEATKASDHDMEAAEKLVPFGILDVLGGLFTIIFGTSRETSDYIADCLQQWWDALQLGLHKKNRSWLSARTSSHNPGFPNQSTIPPPFAQQTPLALVLPYQRTAQNIFSVWFRQSTSLQDELLIRKIQG